jgi:hypothetical protein
LVTNKIVAADKVAINGGSNGGKEFRNLFHDDVLTDILQASWLALVSILPRKARLGLLSQKLE